MEYEYNFINGISFEGAGTGPLATAAPISGSFVVTDSTFEYVFSSTPVLNVSHASILIAHNNSNPVQSGMELGGLADSRFECLLNTVKNASFGVHVFDNAFPVAGTVKYVTSSEILISNNVFSGDQYGVYIEPTFEGGTTCQVVSNTFQNISIPPEGAGIYLGPGTSHCIVAGNSPTTIVNQGTDNLIVNKGLAP